MLNKILAQHPTIYKWDRMWIGIVLGLTVPLAGVFVVYLVSVGAHFFAENKPDIVTIPMMIESMKNMTLLIRYMSVGAILNLGVFYLFINRDYYNVARGIIFATMLIALPVMGAIVAGWFR